MIIKNKTMSYFSRPEVSNSDLNWLKAQLYPREYFDVLEAYRFGNLFDAMVTEPHNVDYVRRKVVGIPEKFTKIDFDKSEKMKISLYKDKFAMDCLNNAEYQKVETRTLDLEYRNFKFTIKARCKWDFKHHLMKWGGDLKSTVAESQRSFVAAAKYFDYDRQRAWYMDIGETDQDILIAVSKKNYKVFNLPITRDSEFYKFGREKYLWLCFKWYCLFGEDKTMLM